MKKIILLCDEYCQLSMNIFKKNSTYMLNKKRIVSIFGDKVDSRDPGRFCVVAQMNLPVTIFAYLKQKKKVRKDGYF